jgi:hypothetical protein
MRVARSVVSGTLLFALWLMLLRLSLGADFTLLFRLAGGRVLVAVLLLSLSCVAVLHVSLPENEPSFTKRRAQVILILSVALTLLPLGLLTLGSESGDLFGIAWLVTTAPLEFVQSRFLGLLQGLGIRGLRVWGPHLHARDLLAILPVHLVTAVPFWVTVLLVASAPAFLHARFRPVGVGS